MVCLAFGLWPDFKEATVEEIKEDETEDDESKDEARLRFAAAPTKTGVNVSFKNSNAFEYELIRSAANKLEIRFQVLSVKNKTSTQQYFEIAPHPFTVRRNLGLTKQTNQIFLA